LLIGYAGIDEPVMRRAFTTLADIVNNSAGE
jgi:hypothetical protein